MVAWVGWVELGTGNFLLLMGRVGLVLTVWVELGCVNENGPMYVSCVAHVVFLPMNEKKEHC